MAKFKEQFNSIIKEEKKKTHTRLINELISLANNNGFINVYEGFSDIEKPDVLLSNERDYLFYGDAKLCENGSKTRKEVVEHVSCQINRFLQHIQDKMLPGGVIAIYVGKIIKGKEWDSMLRQACEKGMCKSLRIAPANSYLHNFNIATVYFIDITKPDN